MNALVATHLALAVGGVVTVATTRSWPLAGALVSTVLVDLVYVFARGWPQTTLVALVGPASVVASALLTFHTPKLLVATLVAPFAVLAPYLLAEGPRLGSTGIAWTIVAAHIYAAIVGLIALALGHDRAPRLHVRLVGLFVATSAPSAYGWTCRALGSSLRSAAVLDCVFLAAIVVWSVAAWARRQST